MSNRVSGFALLEVMIALAILTMGLLGAAAAVYHASSLRESARELQRAFQGARGQLERLRGERLEEIYARYNADPQDDPGGPGAAPGSEFAVPGLEVQGGRRAGRVVFPEAGHPPELREDAIDADLGMAGGRDLNRDGKIDGASRARDYRLLPVRIEVAWQGVRGTSRLAMNALLTLKP